MGLGVIGEELFWREKGSSITEDASYFSEHSLMITCGSQRGFSTWGVYVSPLP